MRRFIISIVGFLIPFIFLLGLYIFIDPFKVIRDYDNYYIVGEVGGVNRSFVSTMNYLNKRAKHHYNSFIFGNSRSLFYRVEDWKKHIPKDSRCYHFSESGGSINGIYYKVKMIDKYHDNLDNALFIIDYSLLNRMDREETFFMMPPALIDNDNWFEFQLKHFMKWLDVRFLALWADYHITGKYKDYMENFLAKGQNYKYYDPDTNEEPRYVQDSLIKEGDYYTTAIINEFKSQRILKDTELKPVLSKERAERLLDIQKILKNNHTNYKIVISPLYDRKKLNLSDLRILQTIFGKDNVYDCSGTNRWTVDYRNYYEPSHYLPHVASEVMDSIYNSH